MFDLTPIVAAGVLPIAAAPPPIGESGTAEQLATAITPALFIPDTGPPPPLR